MDNREILDSQLLEPELCSQILRAVCTAGSDNDPGNGDSFGRNISQWLDHCDETIKNSLDSAARQQNDADVRPRLALAFAESIWTLGVEWEFDSASEGDDRWVGEQLRHAELRKSLVKLAKGLITHNVVSQDLAKEQLDPDILEQVGTIPSAPAFTRKYIRLNTALNFKQTKFNLISEQSEGFSKLVTLIQSSMAGIAPQKLSADILEHVNSNAITQQPMSDAHDTAVIRALRSLPDIQHRVGCLLIDIQRLIGVFNIDPNRVVDIIIDCFMSSVRFYWGFYIALLDASPWCKGPAESKKVAHLVGWKLQFYINGPESDYRYTDELSTVAALLISHGLIRLVDLYPMVEPEDGGAIRKEFEEWRENMKEMSSSGGRNLLSMMGELEAMGENGEDKTVAESDSKTTESGRKNQHALICNKLLSVGCISDALVYLKRFPFLARVHPQIADLAVHIIEKSTDGLYRTIDCVKAPMAPRIRIANPISLSLDETDQPRSAWGLPDIRSGLKPLDSSTHGSTYVLTPLLKKANEVFFYDNFWLIERSRQLPKISTIGDVPRVLAPWLNVAFLRLHQYPSILARLIRICKHGMVDSSTSEDDWLRFLRAWILPAFSLCSPSAGMSNELWMLISSLPLAKRYGLYDYWESVLSSGKLELPSLLSGLSVHSNTAGKRDMAAMGLSLDDALDGFDLDGDLEMQQSDEEDGNSSVCGPYVEIESLCHDVRRKVRSAMRRLSGDTVKSMGRQLCSLCHSAPAIALKVVLDQVCSYDNLVDSVVEAFKYLTPLDSDVMFYVILKILDNPSSNKIKDDGVNAAHWLQSISSFVSAFSHRHENQGLGVILNYVLKRTVSMIRTEDAPPVFDLAIVSDTILRLASIDVMANAADDQILALQGGHYLRLEAYSMVSSWVLPQNATVDTVVAAGSENRLTRRLSGWLTAMFATSGQALSFAMAMCVHAEKVLSMSTMPLSNVLVIYDREIERVYQLFHLLSSNLKPEKYAKLIPGPHVLVEKYGLSWGLAILWGRPSVSVVLNGGLKQWEENGEHVKAVIVEHDTQEGADEEDVPNEPIREAPVSVADTKPSSEPIAEDAAVEGQESQPSLSDLKGGVDDSKMDVDSRPLQPSDSTGKPDLPRVVADLEFEAPLLPRDYVEHIANSLPASAKDIGLSPEFVAVFWTLTLYDIEVPVDRYKKDITIQTNLIKRIETISKQVQSRSKSASLAQIKARATLTIDSLEKEIQEQKLHVSRIRKWLIAQKDYWFCLAHEQRKLVTHALLQHCILPRAVLSASDANFCAKFLWMMHFPLATNKFSLMLVYDSVFSETLSTLLAAFTENEARNYAKFLNTSLAYLAPLHASETNYSERAVNPWRGLTGFQKLWHYERGYLPPVSRTIRQQMPADPRADIGDSRRIKPGSTMLSYDDFRMVMRKWQVALTKAFITTLDSERNDTVRNGILALREMQRSFPAISQCGRRILEKVNEIAANGGASHSKDEDAAADMLDSNKNLKVMATSYGAYLTMAKKNWIAEADYYPAALVSPHPKRGQSSIKHENRETPNAKQNVVSGTGAGVGDQESGNSTPRRDGHSGTSSTNPRSERGQRGRQRPSSSRSLTNEAVAAVAAATAAAAGAAGTAAPSASKDASLSRPRSPADSRQQTLAPSTSGGALGARAERTGSGGKDRYVSSKSNAGATSDDKHHGSGYNQDGKRMRERDRDGGSRGFDRDNVRNRQYEADQRFSPRHSDPDRRESRSLRGSSPAQPSREERTSDTASFKRLREDSASDNKLEPPRQRLATPSAVRRHQQASSAHDTYPSSPSPLSGAGASAGAANLKLSSEEVDRKKKELRAQLLKQQEEKQRQGQKQVSQSAEQRFDRPAQDNRGVSSRHNSREGSRAREQNPSFGGKERIDMKENGNKKGRRGSTRAVEPTDASSGQQQNEHRRLSQPQQHPSGTNSTPHRASDRNSRRQSHRDQALPPANHQHLSDKNTQSGGEIGGIKGSVSRQPRNEASRDTGSTVASATRKVSNERKSNESKNGGGGNGGPRRGFRRTRGSEMHNNKDDNRRYRR
ncbi:THO2 plays a role in transcriptional elongation [Coemansia sp. Benny D160-2]|nr:THO2 plays a role in transcriptional elongation [Coemansia sp. Benny D160-2]